MTQSMIVAVGTTNAAKLSAVRKALEVLFPDKASALEVRGVGVKSGVSDQPMCDEETIQGATNRAQRALDSDTEAQFGIGIEGGCQKIGERWFEAGWTVVVDRNGTVGIGSSARYELSLKIMGHLLSGVELANLRISGKTEVRSKGEVWVMISGILRDVLKQDSCYAHKI
ncbi:Non-canonical purine NTP phosphatase/PRRC1 [Chytriomyces sp. MP71]|nr:Non-canonical purine NTP phosphatase/PRRC1 [Chytriomyces sp. MP71]